ncbi:hypothetical protein CMI38_06945 [Candidatus Pacearchaeota archaeon]|jgi:dipeptidase E|nr:hypothetical protein [Candidatus Pacearchaeota archaeon]|tara:strand:- start:5063 stop:5668 length:606 start_codon:yes stop_codon:yes gene_type:complete
MKLLLTSSGLDTEILREKFLELVRKPAFEIRLLFVPTAANVQRDKSYLERNKSDLVEIGINRENIIDCDLDKDFHDIDFSGIDVIFVAGGNTFYLLDRVRKMGFDKKIREMVDGGVTYIGISAGSILVGPDVGVALPFDPNDCGVEDHTGLNLTDKVVAPHYNRKDQEIIDKFKEESKNDVVVLNDGEGLLVHDDSVEVIR